MELRQSIAALKQQTFSSHQPVLTMYLNTESHRNKHNTWRIHLKNGLKRLQEYAQASGEPLEINTLQSLCRKVKKTIEHMRTQLKNGLIIIADATQNEWFIETLQIPVPNAFYWEAEPHFEELEELLRQYPSTGLISVGSEQVVVYDTFMGEILHESVYRWDIDSEDWKKFKGVAYQYREAASANHRDQFERRFEQNRQRWLKGLTPIIEKQARSFTWEEIILSGEEYLTSMVAKEIQYTNAHIVPKNLNSDPKHEVLRKVYAHL